MVSAGQKHSPTNLASTRIPARSHGFAGAQRLRGEDALQKIVMTLESRTTRLSWTSRGIMTSGLSAWNAIVVLPFAAVGAAVLER